MDWGAGGLPVEPEGSRGAGGNAEAAVVQAVNQKAVQAVTQKAVTQQAVAECGDYIR